MEIKKSTIRWVLPIAIVAIVLCAISSSVIIKKNKEKREQQEIRDDIQRRLDREYRNLKKDFNYYAEIACDWDNSLSYRRRAAGKMYQLTGISWLDDGGFDICTPSVMRARIEDEKDAIDIGLRLKASENIEKELLGE